MKTLPRARKSKVKIKITDIPPALEYEASELLRELTTAVDAIVPLLAKVDPINDRACDVVELLEGKHRGLDAFSQVQALVGLEQLDELMQRLLKAMPRAGTESANPGDLTINRVVAD